MDPAGAAEDRGARVEQLLREAHIGRMRRQWAQAEDLCRQALELAPEDPIGLELLGDLLEEKGSLDEALETYRRAFALLPGRAALEEKIGRAVLQKEERDRERLAAQMLLSVPTSRSERKRNTMVAILLSCLCPGTGQFFNGDTLKGGIILGVWLIGLFLGWGDLFRLALSLMGLLDEPVNGFLAALGLVAVSVHLYSLLDASAQAGRIKKPAGF